VEVFELASTRGLSTESESESCVTTDGQPASLSWNKAPVWGLRPDIYYSLTITVLFLWGTVSDKSCCCPSPAQSFLGPSPFGLVTIFNCLRIETSRFVALFISTGAKSSLYNLGAVPTENTVSQQFFCFYRGVFTSSLHIMAVLPSLHTYSFPWEPVYRSIT
jgi:hypothetical protein